MNAQRLIREAERPCSLESAVPKSFKKDCGGGPFCLDARIEPKCLRCCARVSGGTALFVTMARLEAEFVWSGVRIRQLPDGASSWVVERPLAVAFG